MVISKPLEVLVCLALVLTFPLIGADAGWGYTGIPAAGPAGVEADALSADPSLRTIQPTQPRKPSIQPQQRYQGSKKSSESTHVPSRAPVPDLTQQHSVPQLQVGPGIANPAYCPRFQPVYAPGPPPVAPEWDSGLLGWDGPGLSGTVGALLPPLPFLGFRPVTACSFLPRPGCKQFLLSAKVWYVKLGSSTQLWGTTFPFVAPGLPGTELDLESDLGINKRFYVPEYEARFQIRPHWGIRYQFMPIEQEQTTYVRIGLFPLGPLDTWGFFFGNIWFPSGALIHTRWHRFTHRWDLVYDWFQAPNAVSSVFAGYTLYDDFLSVSSWQGVPNPRGSQRSRLFGLAFAGMSMDRIIRDFGYSGATASCHCKFGLQFLEGYFGWDGSATGRMTVPMNCGRYGFLEAGWRWIVLGRDQITDKDKVSLDGFMAAAGLVF